MQRYVRDGTGCSWLLQKCCWKHFEGDSAASAGILPQCRCAHLFVAVQQAWVSGSAANILCRPSNTSFYACSSCYSPTCCVQGVTAQIKMGAGAKDRLRHPYDLGPCQNLHEILGDNPAAWVLPTCSGTPGGLSYPTTYDTKTDFFAF